MTAVHEQYTERIKQGQEAVQDAFDSWARTMQDAVGKLPVPDPAQAVDQFYAVTTRLLEIQRDFTKSLVDTATSFADTVRTETRKAADPAPPTA
jgi:hypothetical protein